MKVTRTTYLQNLANTAKTATPNSATTTSATAKKIQNLTVSKICDAHTCSEMVYFTKEVSQIIRKNLVLNCGVYLFNSSVFSMGEGLSQSMQKSFFEAGKP